MGWITNPLSANVLIDMTATITTDASFFHQYKIGAFAVWVTTAKGRIIQSGALKGEVNSSIEAEFKAVVNGLHLLCKANIGKLTEIYINTDSKGVILLIEALTLNDESSPEYKEVIEGVKHGWAKDFLDTYLNTRKLLNGNIILRHIRAHEHTNTARHWVNDWCDKEAKKQAKHEIKKRFGIALK
jgi:ribonuclease HI